MPGAVGMFRLVLLLVLLLPAAAGASAYTTSTGTQRNVVIVIHGGAWTAVGAQWADWQLAHTRRFARWGNRVVSTDYAAGAAGLQDVLATYDAERARSPRGRICLYGESAGAHWALMAAAERTSVDCVIDAAGPADLRSPSPFLIPYVGRIFGADAAAYSPALLAGSIHARLLLEYASNDPIVPSTQSILLQRDAAHVETSLLAPGATGWIHSAVTATSLHAARLRERALTYTP